MQEAFENKLTLKLSGWLLNYVFFTLGSPDISRPKHLLQPSFFAGLKSWRIQSCFHSLFLPGRSSSSPTKGIIDACQNTKWRNKIRDILGTHTHTLLVHQQRIETYFNANVTQMDGRWRRKMQGGSWICFLQCHSPTESSWIRFFCQDPVCLLAGLTPGATKNWSIKRRVPYEARFGVWQSMTFKDSCLIRSCTAEI